MKTDYKDKVKKLSDIKYEKAVNSLPLEYTITFTRTKPVFDRSPDGITNGNWDENFTWTVSDNILDHEYGAKLVFNHLLSVVDNMAATDDYYMNVLKAYVIEELSMLEESQDDTKFNK